MYDLRRDRSEQSNVIAKNAAKAEAMAALWQKKDVEFVQTRETAAPSTKAKIRAGTTRRMSW